MNKIIKDYHSALNRKEFETVTYENPRKEFTSKYAHCFVYDVESNIFHESFSNADCIYTEIPYIHGYKIFNQRAKTKGNGYKLFIESIYKLVMQINVPFYICGQFNLPIFKPFYVDKIYSPIHKAHLHLYSNDKNCNHKSIDVLMEYILNKHNVVLDFMCGYGNTLNYTIPTNKKAILSDINPHCIERIYEILSQAKLL